MKPFRLIPDVTTIAFMRFRYLAFALTIALSLVSVVSLATRGLELGIDFSGGLLLEVKGPGPANLAAMRGSLAGIDAGEFTLQEFGSPEEVLIRIQPRSTDQAEIRKTTDKVRAAIGAEYELRRTEFIGPQVSAELLRNGLTAALVSVLAIAVYVWFRFEWQFGVSALLTTFHDVLATFGLFSITGMQFDLTIVAAILTIAGYSINDTVVVFDRIRENLRRYKTMDLRELIDLSVNQTLSRTVLTSGTTLVTALALMIFGGPVLSGFATAFVFGILIGTYSSIFVASALLMYTPSVRIGKFAPSAERQAQPG
jgi:preprotein translocase SecF subunit